MLNVVLVEPEIPQNTGNISRTCAITGARLHLIEPMGFSIDEKHVRRAGLDYWDKLEIFTYKNLEAFFEKNAGGDFYYFSTKAKKFYTDAAYGPDSYLIFGKETKGLPEDLVYGNPDRAVRIPMRKDLRSLNLSNSVAIAVFEAERQLGFQGFV
ncbi:MAG: tRNA (cytidine(34)-2'-O)-methyltransferase [Christensenellaceae bacterium]|nr:tRNA (cytidine(34)-2'-O)-methyltransferase [Christensenellaceae bacterium]